MTGSRTEVDALVRLLDHTLDEDPSAFGWAHWHSLIRNLSTVQPEEWDALPAGAVRSIRDLVTHIGACYLMWQNHAFGDRSRSWGADTVDGLAPAPGKAPEEMLTWFRATHGQFRNSVAALTDNELGELRFTPRGDQIEVRRIVELQIQHSLYHIGEINHLRALLQGNDE